MTKLHGYNNMLLVGITFARVNFPSIKMRNVPFLPCSVCPPMLAIPPYRKRKCSGPVAEREGKKAAGGIGNWDTECTERATAFA